MNNTLSYIEFQFYINKIKKDDIVIQISLNWLSIILSSSENIPKNYNAHSMNKIIELTR